MRESWTQGFKHIVSGLLAVSLLLGATWVSASSPTSNKAKSPPLFRPHPIQQWLKPLLPGKKERKVTKHVGIWLRAWLAGRWGVRSSKKAYKRWVRIWRYLATWDPASLYREIRQKRIEPRLYAKLRGFRFKFRSPRPKESYPPRGRGKAAVGIKLVPMPRSRGQYRRPFRMVFTGRAEVPRLRPQGLDQVLVNFLKGFGALENREVPTPPKNPGLFPSLKKKTFSRKLADFLTVPLPRAARFLNKYVDVKEVASRTRTGHYMLNLRAQWRSKILKKEYRSYRKALKRKYKLHVQTDFLNKKEQVWLRWFYKRKTLTHTVLAMLSKKGFHPFVPRSGKVLDKAFRPTYRLRSKWRTRSSLIYRSKTFQFELTGLELGWDVRPIPGGAQMSLLLLKKPKLIMKGGRLLRRLAHLVIPGGVEGMVDRFLHNLTYGDNGRGFRWRVRWLKSRKGSVIDLRTTIPMVQDRILTSALRIATYFGGSSGKKGKKKRKAPLRRYSLWQRLVRQVYRDFRRLSLSDKALLRMRKRQQQTKGLQKKSKTVKAYKKG